MSDNTNKEYEKIIKNPVEPVPVNPDDGLRGVLLSMADGSFQGRMLGEALKVWESMIDDGCYVYMGLAGAMVPAGMRAVIDWLIATEKIHCLVSTGANLFHELHESIGYRHYKGHPDMDDLLLKELMIDRIYDTLAPDEEFCESDRFIRDFTIKLAQKTDNVTTRRFFDELGAYLKENGKKGFIVTAHEKGVPIFCPAIADSSYGIGMVAFGKKANVTFDIMGDIEEIIEPIYKGKETGVIYLGGGTPKNFIQQAEIVAQELLRHNEGIPIEEAEERLPGHGHAIQITTDMPQWGGLSGCTLEEGQSWGKEAPDAKIVNLHCDVTIALPILANALAEKYK